MKTLICRMIIEWKRVFAPSVVIEDDCWRYIFTHDSPGVCFSRSL